MPRLLGIDPGSASPSGAVYQTAGSGGGIVHALSLTMRGERGTRHHGPDPLALVDVVQTWGVTHVVIEDVWAMPSIEDEKTGERRGMGAQSSWNFGAACGDIRSTIRCCGFEPMFVLPTAWKKAFGLRGATKEDSRQLAIELFPQAAHFLTLKKHEGIAEAMLIARYGAMMLTGRVESVGKVRGAAKQIDEIED